MDLEKVSMTSKISQELPYFTRVSSFLISREWNRQKYIFLSKVYHPLFQIKPQMMQLTQQWSLICLSRDFIFMTQTLPVGIYTSDTSLS